MSFDRGPVSRRQYLKSLVVVGGATALSACLDAVEGEREVPRGTDPASLPDRQHAWNDAVGTDDDGNPEMPRHHVLLYLDLHSDPAPEDRETVASALGTLERAYEWSNDGLLFTVGYSPAYFDRFDASLPGSVDLPPPEPLSTFEDADSIEFDTHDAVIHLASDHPDVVLEADEGLLGEADAVNGVAMDPDLSGVFGVGDRRTGFVGSGLPAERSEEVARVPDGSIHEDAPLSMGFRSGFEDNQASEDRVTIQEGPFAGGATQHVSKTRLQLDVWYTQDNQYQRTAKMFSPKHAEEDLVGEFGEKFDTDTGMTDEVIEGVEDHAAEHGMVGHSQKTARAREDGDPIIIRRDFDTTDDDRPGLHFLALQRGIDDFVKTREAMDGIDLASDTAVGSRLNNGILQYLFVDHRGNFLLPPREYRALPTPRPE